MNTLERKITREYRALAVPTYSSECDPGHQLPISNTSQAFEIAHVFLYMHSGGRRSGRHFSSEIRHWFFNSPRQLSSELPHIINSAWYAEALWSRPLPAIFVFVVLYDDR